MQIIGNNIVRLREVDSTNNYAANLISTTNPPEGTVIMAYSQLSGKGQRGSVWTTKPGENLTFSAILYPKHLKAEQQFIMSRLAALAVAEGIEEATGLVAEIKWPNDILIRQRKVAGILIENVWNGNAISSCIIGVGINVNQQKFDGLPNASSLTNELGRPLETEFVFERVLALMNYYYQVWQRGQVQRIEQAYLDKLFQFGQPAAYKIDGETVMGTIIGVQENGRLQLKIATGQVLNFDIKEIAFVF